MNCNKLKCQFQKSGQWKKTVNWIIKENRKDGKHRIFPQMENQMQEYIFKGSFEFNLMMRLILIFSTTEWARVAFTL